MSLCCFLKESTQHIIGTNEAVKEPSSTIIDALTHRQETKVTHTLFYNTFTISMQYFHEHTCNSEVKSMFVSRHNRACLACENMLCHGPG